MDPFPFDQWIENALRNVIHQALRVAAQEGLPDDHHFFITFQTGAEGVKIPPSLRAEHPDEMTIAIQHQFEDLVVSDDAFAVTLRFSGKAGRLHIPLAAVTSFSDPAVNFGLQLNMTYATSQGEDGKVIVKPVLTDQAEGASDDKATGEIIALDAFRKK
jgi:hypothetical protein